MLSSLGFVHWDDIGFSDFLNQSLLSESSEYQLNMHFVMMLHDDDEEEEKFNIVTFECQCKQLDNLKSFTFAFGFHCNFHSLSSDSSDFHDIHET